MDPCGPPRAARSRTISGGYCAGETPLPIPNRAVKPRSADGTWLARAWESRSPPVLLTSRPLGGSSSLTPLIAAARAALGAARRRPEGVARGCPAPTGLPVLPDQAPAGGAVSLLAPGDGEPARCRPVRAR